jgi:hypothetical protein
MDEPDRLPPELNSAGVRGGPDTEAIVEDRGGRAEVPTAVGADVVGVTDIAIEMMMRTTKFSLNMAACLPPTWRWTAMQRRGRRESPLRP